MSKFKNWAKDRMGEASTYAGIAAVATGVSVLAKAPEIIPVADAIGQNADRLASGDYAGFMTAVLFGIVAMFKKG